MSISKTDVDHVAKLAHLLLDEKETTAMQNAMNRMLEYAKRLDAVETEAVVGKDESNDTNPLRVDREDPWLKPGEATTGAPGAENNLFKVPPAIGGDQE